MLNRCDFIGRVAQDPRCDTVQEGRLERALFSVAVTSRWVDKDGHRRAHTEFVDFIAWGNVAKVIRKFCRQGTKVYCTGMWQTHKWENERGEKVRRTQVVLNRIAFLGKPKGQQKREEDEEDEDKLPPPAERDVNEGPQYGEG